MKHKIFACVEDEVGIELLRLLMQHTRIAPAPLSKQPEMMM